MQHNKIALSKVREDVLLRKANKNPLIKFVLLMNEFHSTKDRYYPSEDIRSEYRMRLEKEIRWLSKRIPQGYACNTKLWLKNKQVWLEAIDSIHVTI